MINTESRSAYQAHVARLEERLSRDQALREAIGGEFVAAGKMEYHLLRSLGLSDGHLVVDVGCGSGRLACQLAPFPSIRYIGSDVVPRLLDYAKDLTARPDWQFVATEGDRIPCGDAQADYVCFFSVFTHLLHEDTFRYFREARRCLRPGGRMVFSFLEFRVAIHWDIFAASVDRATPGQHLNQFISRDGIEAWASRAGFAVEQICGGDTFHIPIPEEIRWENGAVMGGFGNLGQSVAVLKKS